VCRPTPAGSAGAGPMSKYVLDKDERSLDATIAKMAVRDGLPFRVFVAPPDLRKALVSMGFSSIPKSKHTIKNMVMDHGKKIRSYVTGEIHQLKKDGHRFSLTFDEWTSNRNRRYMCINVHAIDSKFWSLGLIRVHGTVPAGKCVELLEHRLSEFCDDIVCKVTDGASVMTKVGKLIRPAQQLCYAHGMQLAVLDVLYKHRLQNTAANNTQEEAETLGDSDSNDSVDDDDEGDIDLVAELSDIYK
jgi:hypothetical protein